jgi:hypothetical protein
MGQGQRQRHGQGAGTGTGTGEKHGHGQGYGQGQDRDRDSTDIYADWSAASGEFIQRVLVYTFKGTVFLTYLHVKTTLPKADESSSSALFLVRLGIRSWGITLKFKYIRDFEIEFK